MFPSLLTLPPSLLLVLPILALSLLSLSLARIPSARIARSSYALIASLGLFSALAGAFGVAATQLSSGSVSLSPGPLDLCALVLRVVLEFLLGVSAIYILALSFLPPLSTQNYRLLIGTLSFFLICDILPALVALFLSPTLQQTPALLASSFQLILNVSLLLLPTLIISVPLCMSRSRSTSTDGASSRYLFPTLYDDTATVTSTPTTHFSSHRWPEPDLESHQHSELNSPYKYSSPHSPTSCTWPFPSTLGQPLRGVCKIDTKGPRTTVPRIKTDLKADGMSRRGHTSIPTSISFVIVQIFAVGAAVISLGDVVLFSGDVDVSVGMGATTVTAIEINLDIARGVFLAIWAAGMMFCLFFVHYRSATPLSFEDDEDCPSPTSASSMSTSMSPMTPGTPAGQGHSQCQMQSPNQSPGQSSTQCENPTQTQGETRGSSQNQNRDRGQGWSVRGFPCPRVSKPISMTSLRSSFGLKPCSRSSAGPSFPWGVGGRDARGGSKSGCGVRGDTPPTSDSDSDFCSLRDPFASTSVVPILSVVPCAPLRVGRTAPELELGDMYSDWVGCGSSGGVGDGVGGVGGAVGGCIGISGVKPQYRFDAPGCGRDRGKGRHGVYAQGGNLGSGLNLGVGLKTRSAAKTLMSAGQLQMPRRVRKKVSGVLSGSNGGSGGKGIGKLSGSTNASSSSSSNGSEGLEVFDAEEAWLAQLLLRTLVGDEQARVDKEREVGTERVGGLRI